MNLQEINWKTQYWRKKMNTTFPAPFRFAMEASRKSSMETKVGACLVAGKQIITGFNKDKTHPIYANPDKHIRLSVHAELDCLRQVTSSCFVHSDLYIYREVHGKPAMARPCEHCMEFLKERGIEEIFYSTPDYPFWKSETL